MLRELSIENLAVIENARASFCGGFNVFTGETGAGKSVLIGGVNAILGQRAARDVVRAGAEKAVITALFDELSDEVRRKIEELGFSSEDELVLSREIFADGKSAARINGRTATASMLREIGELLVDIHGQHDNRILMSNDNQRDILDSYAGISEKIEAYRERFREFSRVSRELKKLSEEEEIRSLKIERLTATIADLQPLELEKGEAEQLEKELKSARASAKNAELLGSAYGCLTAEEGNAALELLRIAEEKLAKVEDSEKAEELRARISSAASELSDVADELFNLSDEAAEEREARLSERVSAIKTAARKYNLGADELVDFLEKCENELVELNGADDKTEELNRKKHALAEEIKKSAGEISELRKNAAKRLSESIQEELAFLDMPNVRIFFELKPDKITINGMDSVELMISANLGEEPKPLNKIASGGELSRIMLAVKCVLAGNDGVPTMIFDEIDSGISGRAAQKVGIKLRELSGKRQVMCITHLAQIAAKADNHLVLEKNTENGRTFTQISQPDFKGRVREIARIIDGSGSAESVAAAEEMLKNRDN
ncbi:MAG: DNA repair protein RecN [Oscillospiraceae bacterium]|nr:DNA repair protein RecN [Oscillospiraceae bacterium]